MAALYKEIDKLLRYWSQYAYSSLIYICYRSEKIVNLIILSIEFTGLVVGFQFCLRQPVTFFEN
jgi:hypothetical protein